MTKSQISLLTKGPKFCPKTNGSFLKVKADTKNFTRTIKLREKFFNSSIADDSLVKSKSIFPVHTELKELRDIIDEIENTDPVIIKRDDDNITQNERIALTELSKADDIIIKKADKGDTLVIMDKEFYRDKLVLQDHLLSDNTYTVTDPQADQKVYKKLHQSGN